MGSILIMVRTSTEAQQTEDQRNEMVNFCLAEGYPLDKQIIIEDQGASAIKLNDKYLAMIGELKQKIEDNPDIDCVAFWALDRAWRTEKVYIDIKDFLVSHRVQMIIKNPYLKLLNPDGSVNGGMEIAISLMTVLAQQEMQSKKDRFRRAKSAMAKQGKWVGGRTRKFGYRVDENHYFVIDEGGTADTVRLIFQLYSTGNHSCETIEKELAERGLVRENGLRIDNMYINKLLRSTCYLGIPDPKNHDRVYPQLISQELFDKCAEIREQNKITMRTKGEHYVLGSKIIKCVECGGTLTASSTVYSCCRHRRYDKLNNQKCSYACSMKISVMDYILWRVAESMHMEYLTNMGENKMIEYNEEIKSINQKIDTLSSKINGVDEKKKKIVDTYLEDLITKEERDRRIKKLMDSIEVDRKSITELSERRFNIENLIKSLQEDSMDDISLNAYYDIHGNLNNDKYKYDIIHKHISKVNIYNETFKPNYRTKNGGNAKKIVVYGMLGEVITFLYVPFSNVNKLYIWEGNNWVPDRLYNIEGPKK